MKRESIIAIAFLCLATFSVYFNALQNNFVNYDDPALVYENPLVSNFDLKKVFTSKVAEDYIPLVIVTFAIEHYFFGLDPFYFHLTNILFHIANVVLIFILIRLITSGRLFVSFVTALLFALHPLHVESVTWVAERKDVLSTFFFLLALLSYYYFLIKRPKKSFYLLALLLFTLGLFAKFMAITLPVILLMMHLWRGDFGKRACFLQIPFAIVGAVFTYVHLLLHNRGEHLPENESTVFAAIQRGFDSLAFYLHQMIVPLKLSAFYERGVVTASWTEYGVAIAFLAVVILLSYKNRMIKMSSIAGGLFFILTIFPVLQIIPFGNNFAFADRFMYLPSLGLFFLISVIWFEVFEKGAFFKKLSGRLVLTAIMVTFGILTVQRNRVWASSQSLWQDEVAKFPKSSIARNNLGSLYLDQGEYPLALSELNAALTLRPSYIDPYINLGLAFLDMNNLSEAQKYLEKALVIDAKSPRANLNLGVILEKQGDYSRALVHYQAAVTLDPELSVAWHNLGVIYYRNKNLDKALEIFQKAISVNPNQAETFHNMGVVYAETSRYEKAIESFQMAIAIDPLYLEPHLQLLQIYQKQQQRELVAKEIALIQSIQERSKNLTHPRARPRRVK